MTNNDKNNDPNPTMSELTRLSDTEYSATMRITLENEHGRFDEEATFVFTNQYALDGSGWTFQVESETLGVTDPIDLFATRRAAVANAKERRHWVWVPSLGDWMALAAY